MTTYEPLIVPIEVEALVATPNIRTSETWYRSELDLHALAENDSIDPDPFAGSAFFSDESQTDYDGNYVMWRLPDSLRHGHQNDETGTIEFPKIPNRWLVLRYSGKRNGKKPDTREATAAFLIESDYLTGDDTKEGSEIEGTSAYVDNRDGQMKITSIGRRFDLDLAKPEHPGWQEKRATRNLFLNAMGPGHVAFTAYQSYNEDVLSFHDDLKDITDDGEVVYYSYCVIGWYSNASFDPLNIPHTHGIGHLTTIDRVAAILNEYGWKADSTDTIEGSLYAGTCLAVPSDGAVTHDDATNDTAGHLYEDARPVPESVTVAVGETVQDALQALPTFGDDHTGIHGQGDSHWIHDQVTGALLYRTVEYLGTVDGPVRTEHQAHSTAFSRESGGYTWQLLPTKDNDAPSTIPAVLLPALTELETAQTAEEHATVRLAEAQQALTDLWWLKGKLASDKDQLPADRKHFKDTYEQRRADQIAEVKRLQDQLARAKRTLHEKEQTLDALTKKQGEDWRIQRAPKSQFTTAHDPVIALKGAKVNRPLTRKDHLPCRLDHDTVISLTIGTDPVTITKPVPGQHLASCLPSRFTATAVRLLHEFALLDQAACTLTAKNTTALTAILDHPDHKVTGHLPEYTRMWNQPWSPLFLLWKVGCYPIPYTNALSDPHPTWTFDGTTYQWSGKGASSNEQTITGRSLLTPSPPFSPAPTLH